MILLLIKFSYLLAIDLIVKHTFFCIRIENLALNKPTWQEHPWPDPSRDFGSENAVYGLYYDRRAVSGQCTINDDGYYTAEWRVDLGSASGIRHINIYYRTDNKSLWSCI